MELESGVYYQIVKIQNPLRNRRIEYNNMPGRVVYKSALVTKNKQDLMNY